VLAMMGGSTPVTEHNMLQAQSMTTEAAPVLDQTLVPSGKSQPALVIDDEADGLAWDRTMGSLFGGTDLLASTYARPTDKKTPAGVSDALLNQTGALMV